MTKTIPYVTKNDIIKQLAFGKIVDVGCFDGRMFGDKAVNVDIIKYADNIPNFILADADHLPFADKKFDCAVYGEVLEHVDDPIKALNEAKRIANAIIFSVPNEHEWIPEYKPFGNPGHKRFFTEETIKRVFADVNIELDQFFKVNFHGWSHFVGRGVIKKMLEKEHSMGNDEEELKLLASYTKTEEESRKNVFDSPLYWHGKIGYRLGPDGIGYRDFEINSDKVAYIMSKNPQGKVLDIGCAMGYIVKRLREKGVDAWGVDISQYAIDHAPDEVKHYLKLASADKLPFGDKEFDLVFSSSVFEHMPPELVMKAISEAVRVAKRGIIAVTPGDDPHFDEDATHKIKQPLWWWREQFPPEFETRSDADEEWIKKEKGKLKLRKNLNIGSFTVMLPAPEWTNIDIIDLSNYAQEHGFQFQHCDATKGLPYNDNEIDFINMSHFIEHLEVDDGIEFLKDCLRVLKPGGTVRLCFPDLKKLIDTWLNGTMSDFDDIQPKEYAEAKSGAQRFWMLLTSGHKTCYDAWAITRSLELAGFDTIHESEFNTKLDMFPTLSITVEAQKPAKEQIPVPVNEENSKPLYKQYLNGAIQEGKEEWT